MSIRECLQQNPLVLAPMAGITDLPFRVICRELGAGIVYSEMIREGNRDRSCDLILLRSAV